MSGRKLSVLSIASALLLAGEASAFFRRESAPERTAQPDKAAGVASKVAASPAAGESELLREIERLQQAFAFFRGERDALKAELEAARQQIQKLESEVAALQKKGGVPAQPRKPKAEAPAAREADPELKKELADALKDLKRERELRTSLESKVQDRDQAIDDLRAEMAGLQRRKAEPVAPPPPPARKETAPQADSDLVETLIEEMTTPPVETAKPAEAKRAVAPVRVIEGEDAMIAEANRLLGEGLLTEAQAIFAEVMRTQPDSKAGMIGLAACAYADSDMDTAETEVKKLLAVDPDNADALGLHGMILSRQGDDEQALAALARAVELAPGNAQLHNYQAIVLHGLGDLPGAVTALKETIRLNPAHVEAHFNLAVVQATAPTPDLAEAKQHYEEALRLGNERNEVLEEILYP